MNNAKKIILFLNDGLPKGLREVTIDQWNGRAVCGPRHKINELIKDFGDLNGPCIYFLIGQTDDGDSLKVYVGESDPFVDRIKTHDRKKEWWDQFVVFFGPNKNPNKTGIKYLETTSVAELKDASRCVLDNGNIPPSPGVPKEDIPGLLTFYENIKLIMPLLGFDIFQPQSEARSKQNIKNDHLFCGGKDAKAEAILLADGKLKVLKGSTIILENAPSFLTHNYKKIKDQLLQSNILKEKDGFLYFVEDYIFDSLSAAAAVVLARSAQGPKEWKNKDNISIKDFVGK